MIVHASKNGSEIWIVIKETETATEEKFKLTMSTSRHLYKYIHKSESKEQNGILTDAVDVQHVVTDAKEIGEALEATPGLLSDKTYDHECSSKRKYRCDNYKGEAGLNHFYPIGGRDSDYWSCTFTEFEKAKAFRMLQRSVNKTRSIPKTLNNELNLIIGTNDFRQKRPAWYALRKRLIALSSDEPAMKHVESLGKQKKSDDELLGGLMPSFGLGDFDVPASPGSRSRSSSFGSEGSRSRSGSTGSASSESGGGWWNGGSDFWEDE